MLELIQRVHQHAPAGSILIVEADERFDFALLPDGLNGVGTWDVRTYLPAVIGIWRG
jgi:hypothetical protein